MNKVAVIYGHVPPDAPADEQDVLTEVEAVSAALASFGYEPVKLAVTLDLSKMARELANVRPAFVFNLVESLEGKGRLIHLAPAVLEHLGVSFTGAGAEALYQTSNKPLAKRLMRAAGIPTPEWGLGEGRYIIKSVWEHASIGIDGGIDGGSVIEGDGATIEAAISQKAMEHGGEWFAEAYVEGRELSVSVLGGPDGPVVLPPAEIRFVGDWGGRPRLVDYKAKWDAGSPEYAATVRSFEFAEGDAPLLSRLRDVSLSCWRLFGLRGYARVDFRVDETGRPFVLEVNANPCLSPDAGLAAAADEAGLGYDRLVGGITDDR